MNKSITMRSFVPLLCLSSFLQYRPAIAQSALGMTIDSLFTVYSDSGFSGAALVAERGRVTLRKGYGYANSDSKTFHTPATLFNIASLGKQFTAYSILLTHRRPFRNIKYNSDIHSSAKADAQSRARLIQLSSFNGAHICVRKEKAEMKTATIG